MSRIRIPLALALACVAARPLPAQTCASPRSASAGTSPIFYLPGFAEADSAQNPPIATFNRNAIWQEAQFFDTGTVASATLTVSLAPDSTCSAPSNADVSYRSVAAGGNGCSNLIAPAEFQIGLRAPDGTYVPLLDRASGAAAETPVSSLCLVFNTSTGPGLCASPGTPVGYGSAISGITGKTLGGRWMIMISRTQGVTLFENPPGSGIYHDQGGATVAGITFSPVVNAPCALDLRLLGLGVSGDDCRTGGGGDANGYFEGGETAQVRPFLFNNSAVTASSVSGSLSTTDPTYSLSGGNLNFGSLAPGAVVQASNGNTLTSTGATCALRPLSLSVSASGNYNATLPINLQEGRLQDPVLATLAGADSTVPSNWTNLNDSGYVYDSVNFNRWNYGAISEYHPNGSCSSMPPNNADADRFWPFWSGGWTGAQAPNKSLPYLLEPLFTNTACSQQTIPHDAHASGPNDACLYPIGGLRYMMGNSSGLPINHILMNSQTLDWGGNNVGFGVLNPGFYPSPCDPNSAAYVFRAADVRLQTPSVSATSYGRVRLRFNHALWTFWDLGAVGETVLRDGVIAVDVASSLTTGNLACPLDSIDGRRWCNVYKLRNQSTPFTGSIPFSSESIDVSAYAAGATGVQVRFRYTDPGWYQQRMGDRYWALRDIYLEALGGQQTLCSVCGPCQTPVFSGLASVAELGACADTGVQLSWTDPGVDANWGDGGKNNSARLFNVFRSDNPSTPLATVPWTTGVTNWTYTDNSATNNQPYQYWVIAVNACGVGSSTGGVQRNGTDLVPTSPAFAVTAGAADANSCSATGVAVSWATPSAWNDNGANLSSRRFRVYRSDNPSTALSGGGCGSGSLINAALVGCTDSTAVVGTPYTYVVQAANGCDVRTNSGTSPSAVDATGSAPGGLSNNTTGDGSVCASGVIVNWSAPTSWNDGGTGSRGFRVLRDGVLLASGPCSGTLSGAAVTCTDTSVTPNTSHNYQVRAVNGCSFSTTTSGAGGTDAADLTPPSTVVNNQAAKVSTNLVLTWDPSSDANGVSNYRVYGSPSPSPLTTLLIAPAGTTASDPINSTNNFYTITAVDACSNESAR